MNTQRTTKSKRDNVPSLIELFDRFNTDEAARLHLESIRWASGVVCPHCQNSDQAKFSIIAENKSKKVRPGLRCCLECRKQFTVTVGTIFESSHIPLRKWVIAWHLLAASKKGISSLQIQRMLDLGSYRTALFMMHRIRFALKHPVFSEKLAGPVEIDETYVGGKIRTGFGKRGKPGPNSNKTPVVSLVSRAGEKRSMVMQRVNGKNIKAAVYKHVADGSTIMTDQSSVYCSVGRNFRRKSVNHSLGEYARGEVHTNTVESSFSLLKRGVIGTFHNISKHHLHLYLAEFDFRWNLRKTSDGERTTAGIRMCEGKRLQYSAMH